MENLPGVHLAPNIQTAPDIYEIENRAVDPEQLIEKAMQEVLVWEGKIMLDLGAGTGFHIERFHQKAAHVIAVEPHDPSRLLAMKRCAARGLERVSIMKGSAAQVWLPDHSVDIVHARFAYFFAPDCEPGVAELARLIRPGGAAFIIDNNLESGTFANWLKRSPYHREVAPVKEFWAAHGFQLRDIKSEWRFESRADLEAVVRNEFPPALAAEFLAEHPGTTVDYHYWLFYKKY